MMSWRQAIDIESIIKKFEEINWDELLRRDLQSHHLMELKPHLDFIKGCFKKLITLYREDILNTSGSQESLFRSLDEFLSIENKILSFSDINEKIGLIKTVKNFKNDLLQENESTINFLRNRDYLTLGFKEERKYEKDKKEMKEVIETGKKLISQLQSETVKGEASQYGNFFNKEAKENKQKYKWYMVFLILSILVSLSGTYCYLGFDQKIEAINLPALIIKGNVINKVFIFSIMFLFITLLVRQYLAMRHQHTLNKHRHNSLSSHKEILSSIKETQNESDKEIANAILLELTKSMFTPHDTGFVKNPINSSSRNQVFEVTKSFLNLPTKRNTP